MVFLVAEWLLDILGNQYYMIIIFVIGLVVATFLLNKEEAKEDTSTPSIKISGHHNAALNQAKNEETTPTEDQAEKPDTSSGDLTNSSTTNNPKNDLRERHQFYARKQKEESLKQRERELLEKEHSLELDTEKNELIKKEIALADKEKVADEKLQNAKNKEAAARLAENKASWAKKEIKRIVNEAKRNED